MMCWGYEYEAMGTYEFTSYEVLGLRRWAHIIWDDWFKTMGRDEFTSYEMLGLR